MVEGPSAMPEAVTAADVPQQAAVVSGPVSPRLVSSGEPTAVVPEAVQL